MRRAVAKSASPSLTRWETVGAWLQIWTPPKDVEVPPVPRRKLAIWSLVGAGAIALALALIVPPLERGKREGAAERAREKAAAAAAEVKRLRVDQRVHLRTVPAGANLVPSLERAVDADARRRARAGTLDGPVLSTGCSPAGADVVQFRHSRVFKCFVKTSTRHRGVLPGDEFGTGYPFVATVYFQSRRIAWCKQNPHPDEKGNRAFLRARMSPVCAGKLSQVL